MPTTTDLIGLAIDKNPVDFAATFDEILRAKAEDAIEARKVELAKSIYGDSEETDEDQLDVGEGEFDHEDADTSSDDDAVVSDDDDLDLDLDDLDLDLDEIDLDVGDISDDNEDA